MLCMFTLKRNKSKSYGELFFGLLLIFFRELKKPSTQKFWYRDSELVCVLDNAYSLIADVKQNNSNPESLFRVE